MPLRRLLPMLLLLALSACLIVPPQEPAGPSFYVMRHLHATPGTSDPELTEEGQRQSRLLPGFFELDKPAAIYVSNTRRAQQTAAPLAQSLGLTPKLYDPANTPGLVLAVQAEQGSILIVGHSNTVPDIVAALGGARPPAIAHDQFGDIWHVHGYKRDTQQFKLGQ